MNSISIQEKENVILQCILVGLGGTGSHYLRTMLQILNAYFSISENNDITVDITLVDADKVEKKNYNRQLFDENDLGEYKVVALKERYGDYYNVNCKTVTEYATNIEILTKLFGRGHLEIRPNVQVIPILISLIDNNKSRQVFHEFFHSDLDLIKNLIWIDVGIEGVMIVEDPTPDQEKQIRFSGFGGQVVCGYKYKNQTILEPVTKVYPNILDDEITFFPGQSCGDTIVNNPQRLVTNQLAAQVVAMIFNNIINDLKIITHVVNFNAQFAQSKPRFISNQQMDLYRGVRDAKIELSNDLNS